MQAVDVLVKSLSQSYVAAAAMNTLRSTCSQWLGISFARGMNLLA